MAATEQYPLKEWKEALTKEHIDFETFEDHLYVKLDKRDEEGHHRMRINIYFDEEKGVYANFSALGEVISKLPPSEAIEKFKTYKLVYFTD